jgi:hypothetical protein
MAQKKTTADSFLFEATRGKKWNIIKRHFGNDGLVMWIILLQELCISDNHYINGSKVMLEELAYQASVEVEVMKQFIDFVSDNFTDHFNTELWFKYQIIRNDKLIEQLSDSLYLKRVNKPLSVSELKNKFKQIEDNDNENELNRTELN